MYIKAKITLEYQKEKQAEIALKSLNPDNMGFITTKREDNNVVCELEGESLRTILATADDLLFSEMTVEKMETLSKTHLKKPPSPE